MASTALTHERTLPTGHRRRRHRSRPYRRTMFRAAALLGSLALGLAISELGLRIFGPQDNREWGQGHPLWHHGYHANFEHVVRDDHGEFGGHEVRFNAEGLPMRDELPPADAPCLVFLGDSFTAGLEVPESERFVTQLGRELNRPVVNFGCGSFSPLLSRIQFEHYLDRLQPLGVVLQLSPNDVDGDFAKHQLATRDAQGRALAVPQENPLFGLVSGSRILRVAQRSYRTWRHDAAMRERAGPQWDGDPWSPMFNRPLEEWFTWPERRPIETSIEEIAELCQGRKIPLWLCCVPDRGAVFKGQTDYFSEYFLRFARQHQIATIDLETPFRQLDVSELYFRVDGHFTAAGHHAAAEAIRPVIEATLKATAPAPATASGPATP